MNDPSEVREVRSLLDEPGCVPCLAEARGARRYLHQVLWEGVTDVDVRRRIRDSGGFCREHFAVAVDLGRDEGLAPGLAIILEDLLGRLGEAAPRWASESETTRTKARRKLRSAPLEPGARGACPACEAARASSERALWLLARVETGTDLAQEIVAPGRVLCAPHLRAGFADATTEEHRDRLLFQFEVGARRSREDLAGFIRKTDQRHRDEAMTTDEAISWERGGDLITGALPFRRRSR